MYKVLKKKGTSGVGYLTHYTSCSWGSAGSKKHPDVLVFTSQFAIDTALMALSDDHNLSESWEAVEAFD